MTDIGLPELIKTLRTSMQVAHPGDTVILRFGRRLSAPEVEAIHHILEPLAKNGRLGVAIVDDCESVTIIHQGIATWCPTPRREYAKSAQQAHEDAEEHAQSHPRQEAQTPHTGADPSGRAHEGSPTGPGGPSGDLEIPPDSVGEGA